MEFTSALKNKAKAKLSGRWNECALFSLAYIVIIAILTFLFSKITSPSVQSAHDLFRLLRNSSGMGFIAPLITVPFGYGVTSYFLKVSRGKQAEFSELWSAFKIFLTVIIAGILINIYLYLWSLLLFFPAVIAFYRYRMTYFIMVDNPETDGLTAITQSKIMMMGHKMDLFKLDLSFIGWIFLGLITGGIAFIWILPYMQTTYSIFYNNISGNPDADKYFEADYTIE